ncbi:MAG: signal peptide peptidase SppA [Planctomyces sp.]|nr:signal peptide peptidase SppA [Planctomyces sp.]
MLPKRYAILTGLAALVASATARPTAALAAPAKGAETATIAVFTLDSVSEVPTPDDPIFGAMGGESLIGLVQRIDKAAKDPAVKGIILLVGGGGLGQGQIEEVRQVLARFRESGKPIYAHADSLTTGTYSVLCGSNRLSVSPTGDVFLTGIYGEQMYLHGLLSKFQIEPDFLTCGSYKSAAEMFTRSGPSDEAREMYTWLYDSIYDSMIALIAEGRGVSGDQAREWIDRGLFSAERALAGGLIDAAEHRQSFQEHVSAQHGGTVKYDRSYGRAKGPEIDLNNPFAALQLWAQILSGPQQKKSTKDAIAIVYVDGPIMVGNADISPLGGTGGAFSEPIRKALDEAARDDKVKAVVLRVDSPGGSAIASEIILNATRRVKEKKPLIVSMGNVAGSGGYYVACGSDVIFADKATITGSIGVVAGKLGTNAMWENLGIHFEPIARGKRAGILSSGERFTDEERQELQGWMDEVYGVFKGHVVSIRGDRLKKPIDDLAGGRVFTGAQALEYGLVDRLGTLSDAIAHAAEQAGVTDYETRALPKPTNFLEQLLGDVTGPKKDDQHITTETRVNLSPLGQLRNFALPALSELEPQRAKLVLQALTQLQILHQERVSLSMPILDVRH